LTQQLVCKQCRQSLAGDVSESEEGSLLPSEGSTKGKQEQVVESYLTEEVIRIDNGNATTPFGIFFVVCLVAVLAIASLHPPPASPRLLLDNPAPTYQEPFRNFVDYIKSKGNLPGECAGGQKGAQPRRNLRSYTLPDVGWTKVGEFICSAPY
jgi:hypothetical protein